MPEPPKPDTSAAWSEFIRSMSGRDPRTEGLPPLHFGQPCPVVVDACCPDCGASPPLWKLQQVLGATPGTALAGPAQGAGMSWHCGRCGVDVVYRQQLP